MVQIIATFNDFTEAQALITRLSDAGIAPSLFSIIDAQPKLQTTRRIGLGLAISLGVLAALFVPNISYWQLSLPISLHLFGVIAFRMLTGAVTGGAVELLFHTAILPGTISLKSDRFSVALESDFETIQPAQLTFESFYTANNERLFGLVQKYGYEHQSFLSLYDGSEVWFAADNDAAVVFRRIGRVAIVTAAPLAAREELKTVTQQFLAFCQQQNLDCLMLPISKEFSEIARACGMGLLPVGESGYFKLPEWKPAGDRAKKVRAGVNQARGAGLTVKAFDPESEMSFVLRKEIDQLCEDWIESREIDALGWLLELNPFKFSEQKRYFLAHNAAGKLAGMLACSPIPARNGWYLEDLIRSSNSERGVSELLVVEALKQLAAEGAELATLGTSPLANIKVGEQFRLTTRILQFIYERFDSYYHFKQLHRFKAKFAPTFTDTEYLAIWPPRARMRMVRAAILVLDPRGLTGMTSAKLRKLWKKFQQ